MSNIIVDVEADGPCPGMYSMVSFGAVVLSEGLNKTFYGQLRPLDDATADYIPEALAVSGHSREEVMTFRDPTFVMQEFASWITKESKGRPIFWNPFGFSSQNINSLYKGITRDLFVSFKHLRKTKHTHHPVDDAKGNAEALIAMRDFKNLKINVDS